VRLRALVFLLALTAGDYMLWGWSIANGHDVVSLVAGLTLLPLAAVGLGQLVLAGGRLLGMLLRHSSLGRSSRGVPHAPGERTSRKDVTAEHARHASTSESDSPSGRLAA
jgi:hypothetical protein